MSINNTSPNDKDVALFYEEKLLAMAESLTREQLEKSQQEDRSSAMATAPYQGQFYSRMCGSCITTAFWLGGKGSGRRDDGDDLVITKVFFTPEACLLGKVSALLAEELLLGASYGDIKLLRNMIDDFLKDKRQELPAPYQMFECFKTIRYLTNRHGAILMPFDSIVDIWQKSKKTDA